MDIKITCRACDRMFPLTMVTDPEGKPGYCPFCGEVLAFQYANTLVRTAEQAMAAGQEFTRQLTLLAELAGSFAIDAESVLAPLRDCIALQEARVAEPYRPGWPPRPGEPVR